MNGVYRYGSTSLFPTDTYQASNYWVDVVFVTDLPPDTTPPSVSAISPEDAATDVGLAAAVTATFSEAMNSATITADNFELRDFGRRTGAHRAHVRRFREDRSAHAEHVARAAVDATS